MDAPRTLSDSLLVAASRELKGKARRVFVAKVCRVYAEEAVEKRRLVLVGDERWLPEVLKNLIRLIPRSLARPNAEVENCLLYTSPSPRDRG